jgi:hypothetical protein
LETGSLRFFAIQCLFRDAPNIKRASYPICMQADSTYMLAFNYCLPDWLPVSSTLILETGQTFGDTHFNCILAASPVLHFFWRRKPIQDSARMPYPIFVFSIVLLREITQQSLWESGKAEPLFGEAFPLSHRLRISLGYTHKFC